MSGINKRRETPAGINKRRNTPAGINKRRNILVYLCGVRARKSDNLFTWGAILIYEGEGSNNNNNNNSNMAFPQGGPERGNPAMDGKRLAPGS